MDIGAYRREYMREGLHRKHLHKDPFKQFEQWFQQARTAEIVDANAMSLATVSASGKPTIRTVLIKTFDHNGFVFFTNYASQKAQQIAENPHVAVLFPWTELERQIEITGVAERIAPMESMKYIISRPRGSQLGAWVSHQSHEITKRKVLKERLEALSQKFKAGAIPVPTFWGGYRIVPQTIEFWQGRENRLHDRFEYSREQQDWCIKRLAP